MNLENRKKNHKYKYYELLNLYTYRYASAVKFTKEGIIAPSNWPLDKLL